MAHRQSLCKAIKELMSRGFNKSRGKSHEAFLYVLRTRAWLIYTLITFYRAAQALTKTGFWFNEPVGCSSEQFQDCLGSYREDLLEPIEGISRFMLRFSIGVAVVINVLSYKWRFLADYCLYMETFMRLCAVFFPNESE